ncbi:MAG: 1-acyl-sn-glycerol-3-phosphate acyltransferase [Candidatus Hydrogenedentes bacterium]|nr:1-acyl-sn-glycerol-3-phosphate acyltransferase [Candidatus Hydrogenedentota bacterium]
MGFWVNVRLSMRVVALALWTFLLFPVRCLSLIIAPLARTAEERWRRLLFRVWAMGACHIAGMRVTLIGTPPKPPFYLVTNHLTLVDVVLLARTTGCVFVSRADVQDVGVLGFMAKAMNTIFIDRAKVRDTHRVNEIINASLDKGYGVHFFAESRISQDARVHPFKPPLLEPAVQRGMPVHYAAISYSTPQGAPRARDVIVWKDGVSLAGCILNVLRLPSFTATIHFGDAPIFVPDRKVLAEKLYRATLERFTPVD